MDDSDLILQMQSGNLDALGKLYDQYQQLVYRTALAITGDPNDAADLLQDVFLRMYRFSDHIDPTRPLAPWLYRVTTNLAYTWVKRNRRWVRNFEEIADWLIGSHRIHTDTDPEQFLEYPDIHKALQSLPLPQRAVVALYYINDLSLQEISEILDIPVGTVKSRLFYGRDGLKKHISSPDRNGLGDLVFDVS